MTQAERFRVVRGHPEYDAAMRHTPSVPTMAGIVFPLIVLAFCVSMVVLNQSELDGGLPMHLKLLIGGVLIGIIGGAGYALVKGLRFRYAPIYRAIAVVVEQRTVASSRGNDSPGFTRHFATVELEGGRRVELQCSTAVAFQEVTEGAIGIAYQKGDRLVGFRRIGV